MFGSAQVNPLEQSPIPLPTKLPNISLGIHVGEKNQLIINYLTFEPYSILYFLNIKSLNFQGRQLPCKLREYYPWIWHSTKSCSPLWRITSLMGVIWVTDWPLAYLSVYTCSCHIHSDSYANVSIWLLTWSYCTRTQRNTHHFILNQLQSFLFILQIGHYVDFLERRWLMNFFQDS